MKPPPEGYEIVTFAEGEKVQPGDVYFLETPTGHWLLSNDVGFEPSAETYARKIKPEAPMTNWTPMSERLPTQADADACGDRFVVTIEYPQSSNRYSISGKSLPWVLNFEFLDRTITAWAPDPLPDPFVPPEPEKPKRMTVLVGSDDICCHLSQHGADTCSRSGIHYRRTVLAQSDPTPEAVQDVAYQLRHESQKYMAGNNTCVLSKWLVRLADTLEGK